MQVFNHQPRQVGKTVQRRINALGIGEKMQDLPEELWHESFRYYVKEDLNRKGGPNLRMIRLEPDKPSLTVTGYIFNKFVHPFENRFITPREAARLQGFPDEIEFKGTLSSVQRQIGDAVPLEMGEAIFASVLKTIKQYQPSQKKFLALSLFSGAGGFDIALERVQSPDGSRFITVGCIEVDKDRCETLNGYFGHRVNIFNNDISTLKAAEILADCSIEPQDISLVYGGPPCQSFSQAGKQKGIGDPRGVLIFEFLRFIDEIKPPYFVMENVRNLKGIARGRLLTDIVKEAETIGYDVNYAVLNSAHYGNAQKRKRLIFLGSRRNVQPKLSFPTPTHSDKPGFFTKPYKTVQEAFSGLPIPDYEPIAPSD
jgi:DNA (cytosine-5)-methyltransferase 1